MTTGTIYDNMVWDPKLSLWETETADHFAYVEKFEGRFYWTRASDEGLAQGVEDTWEMAASFAMLGDTYVDFATEDDAQWMELALRQAAEGGEDKL